MALRNLQYPNQPRVIYHWGRTDQPSFSRDPSDVVRVYHRSPIPSNPTLLYSESWEPVTSDHFSVPLYLYQIEIDIYEYLPYMWKSQGEEHPSLTLHVVQDQKWLGFFTSRPLEAEPPPTTSRYERDLGI